MDIFNSKLSNLRINDCVTMKPKDFHFIANKCPNLTSLNLASCFSLTDECVTDLTLKCSKLRNLNISNTITISDVSIDSIGLHCPQLTSLAFGFEANAAFQNKVQLTSASVVVLSRRCSNIIELAVTNTLLSDAAFVALITANKSLKSVTLISNFNMQGEAVMAAIAVNCRGLQKLKLETVERFNSLVRVAMNCRELRDLSVLYMRCDDNEMHMLLQSCRSLESFALAYRHGNTLTDVTASNILKHCPRITQLNIAGVAYTVKGLQCIIASQVAVNLNLLDLSYNNSVNDLNLLEAVLSTCSQLKYLYICKCKYPVTSVISAVRRLRDSGAVPSLETVNFAVDSQIIDGGVYKRIYDPQTLIVDYKVADIPNVIFRMLKSDREALRREELGFGEQVYHAAVDIVTGAQSVAQSVFGYFTGYMKK